MNTINKMKVFVSIALIAIIMIGCSKDDDDNDDNNNNNTPDSGSMQLDVDGNTWTPDNVASASALGVIALSGDESDSDQHISFLFPNDISAGTYDLTAGEITPIYISEDGSTYMATSGTLEVTTHNTTTNKFKGTFSFEASDFVMDTVSITNGSFDVTYIEAKK